MTMTPARLKRLVAYRERLERLQEQEVAAALRHEALRERALAASRDARDAVFGAGAPGSGPIDPAELHAAAGYLRRMEREIAAREAAVAASRIEVAEERGLLMERSRDRKAMETLLEHRLAGERLARNRADLRRLDDIATRRWVDARGAG
ncbi:MAG: flagellar export protein FliJ [Chloroflexi bacterium]|nr:flagellar export protein FliJ [Chloroflexota bacterium]